MLLSLRGSREEIRSGKTLSSSLDSGFSKAFRAILDSNITTLSCFCVALFRDRPNTGIRKDAYNRYFSQHVYGYFLYPFHLKIGDGTEHKE